MTRKDAVSREVVGYVLGSSVAGCQLRHSTADRQLFQCLAQVFLAGKNACYTVQRLTDLDFSIRSVDAGIGLVFHMNHYSNRSTVCVNRNKSVQTDGRLSDKFGLVRCGEVSRRLPPEFKTVSLWILFNCFYYTHLRPKTDRYLNCKMQRLRLKKQPRRTLTMPHDYCGTVPAQLLVQRGIDKRSAASGYWRCHINIYGTFPMRPLYG